MVGTRLLLAVAALALSAWASAQPLANATGLIRQNAGQKISPHVTVIPDDDAPLVPNVGIVVGERATLIVDTGLGERNGRIVLAEARKAGRNTEFYVMATHFHPEHDLGATAFPANAKMLRSREQQKDADELGADLTKRFAGFSPAIADLLKDAKYRPADIVFDDALVLDLGGVHVRVWGVGPTHTRGDTVFYVEEDRVLFAGDVVMPVFVAANGQMSSVAKWLADLDEFDKLNPAKVVPAHGRMGGIELIRRQREYLAAVQSGVAAAKREGKSVEDAQKALAGEIAAKFPDLAPNGGGPAAGRINAAIQAAYREEK
ncbi:MAG TPA: MBL fold metallo-hydrolase [Gammaproteobacteria bacterium]|nr:MBL fold metallo-hydrolase [Gammaproteobacteria bacterium]